jgi:hypothetical protein
MGNIAVLLGPLDSEFERKISVKIHLMLRQIEVGIIFSCPCQYLYRNLGIKDPLGRTEVFIVG